MTQAREDFGRMSALTITIAQELHLLTLDLHQVDYWLTMPNAEQALCALERCRERIRWIGRQCGHALNGDDRPPLVDPPRLKT